MRQRHIPSAVCVGIIAAVAAAFAISGATPRALIYHGAGWCSVVAFAVALQRAEPAERAGLRCLLAAQTLIASADVLYFHHEWLFGWVPDSGMGWAEPAYLISYPTLVVGLSVLARRRGSRLPHALDAAMIATTVGLFAWVLFVRPIVDEFTIAGAAQVVAVAHTVQSVVVIGFVAWFALAPTPITSAGRGLVVGYCGWFAAAMYYGRQALVGDYQPAGWLDLAFIVSYLVVALAAVHPTMPGVGHALPADDVLQVSRRRIFGIGAAALVGPVVLGVGWVGGGEADVSELATGYAVLFVLAVVRMGGLVTALGGAVSQLRRADRERGRLLGAVMEASEVERSLLSMELHDGPIQHMAAVNLQLDLAMFAVEAGDLEGARAMLDDVRSAVKAEVHALREMMTGLRPPALDERGLADAVTDLVSQFAERSDLRVSVASAVRTRVDPVGETVLYRVLQESLDNIHKHARASQVDVSVVTDGGQVSLTVVDDGVGFDAEDPRVVAKAGHLGLSAMRERVELAGGTLEISSVRDVGTTVRAILLADETEEGGPDGELSRAGRAR